MSGADVGDVDDGVMALIAQMASESAGQEQAQTRQLSSAEEALMQKLMKGKTTKQQKLIENAFKSSDMVAQLQKAEQQKADDAMAAKMKAPRPKKLKATPAEGAAMDVTDAAAQALKIIETLQELKDEALAGGKIKSEADAKKVEAQALEATLTDEQRNSEQFMKMLKQMTEAEANVEVATQRQLSAAEEAMLKKMQRGKTTKQQKLIEKAFQDQSFVNNVQDIAKKQQDEAMQAKLAAGRALKKKKAKEEDEEKTAVADASSAGAATSPATQPASVMDQALKVMENFQPQSNGKVDSAAVEATLTPEQKNNLEFMKMLKQMTEAEANIEVANQRQLSSAEEAMKAKLMKGKSTKQQKLIEKAFQDSQFVEDVQKQTAKAQEEAMAAKLAAGKKKKAGAKAAEEEKQAAGGSEEPKEKKKPMGRVKLALQNAAESAAQMDAMVASILYATDALELAKAEGRSSLTAEELSVARTRAFQENLSDDQQTNVAFTEKVTELVEKSLAAQPDEKKELTEDEEAALKRTGQGRTAKQQAVLALLFRDEFVGERLLTQETQKMEDAQLAKLLQAKQAKKKEMAAHQAAADSAAQLDCVVMALCYIEEARLEKAGTPLTQDEILHLQSRAITETLTLDQKKVHGVAGSEFVQLLSSLMSEYAGKPPADPRVLEDEDEALLTKLREDKVPLIAELLGVLFHDAPLVEKLKGLDAQKTEDARIAAMLQAKARKKKEREEAELEKEEEKEAERVELEEKKAVETQAEADVQEAVGVDGAAEFAAMLKQASEQQANQEFALTRQSDLQAEALMKKLAAGKSTKQKKLIEKAFNESGLVDAARDAAQKKQDEELAARLAAGRRKKQAAAAAAAEAKSAEMEEEKYPDSASAARGVTKEEQSSAGVGAAAPVVDYLEQKYGEMLASESSTDSSSSSLKAAAAEKAAAVLENQEAIAQATNLGMGLGANGVEVAEIAAQAAALGLAPEQITAAASAAAAVAGMADDGADDHATFMELFRKATEDAAAEQLRKKSAQSSQDDAFMRKLLQGKKTKQQQMVDKQMADILAASEKARSFQSQQDAEMAARLARGKAKKAAAAGATPAVVQAEEAARYAAEALASEMLLSGDDRLEKTALQVAQEEIEQILAAPTILDELLAVSDAQSEEISKQARETGIPEEDIIEANKEALELDNMAAQLMLERAREAEAMGDMEGAAAFMDMYRRMIEEGVNRDGAVKRQLSDAEEAMMRKLMKGKTTKQQKLIEKAFQNSALVDAIMNQEAARMEALMNAKLAAGKHKKKNDALVKQGEEAFARLRKIFLGAIKKLDAPSIIRQLDEVKSLVDEGYLDLSKPVKESGETMLHQASKYGRQEVVEWLLKLGAAKPNAVNAQGQSALHYAALALDPDGPDKISPDAAATACMLLIESGGDVLLSDFQHETPLSIAARLGFDLSNLANTPEALAALQLERQKEALQLQRQQMEMHSESLQGLSTDVSQEESSKAALAAQIAAETATKLAAQLSDESSLTTGLMIDPSTGLPMTAQQLQFHKEELETLMNEEKLEIIHVVALPPKDQQDSAKVKAANLVFIQLCDLFKDINNSRNEYEATALIKANLELIREGYLDLSKPIKNKQDGSTLLHSAVFHQKLNLVRQLLQNKADPNKITMTGETPLHLACALADREPHGKAIVSLLLEAGARRDVRDFKNGHTPFEHAPTAALKKWMEEWQNLAERQRLALLNQMGGLEDMLNKNTKNLQSAAFDAENSFLNKLMKGKLTKQGKLVEEALKNSDLLNARTLTEQQRQLEAMQARLAKGRAKKAGVLGIMNMSDDALNLAVGMMTGTKEEMAAKKKQAFLEDMLLQELSEPTKDKIMLTAEKWADHANGLSGLDIGVLQKLRGMPIADAMRLLAQEIAHAESEQLRLNHAINAPGLDDRQAQEYERQFNIADCNADIYSDLTNNMLEAEKQRQDAERQAQEGSGGGAGGVQMHMSEEDLQVQAAKERLEKIETKKRLARAAQGGLPQAMMERIAQLFSEYIALTTGYEVEPALILQGALPMDDLAAYQLDVDTIEHMLAATEIEPAKVFVAKQTMVNEAVQTNLERHLQQETLTGQQREEAEIHARLFQSNASLYDELMTVLMSDVTQQSMQSMQDETALAQQRVDERLAEKEARLVHPDTGLAVNMHIQQHLLEAMRELAAEFLGMDPQEMNDLSTDQLQQALAKAGVNVDVLEELRKLTEAEAGKWLAKEMAKNEAESDMLRKLLSGSKLSDKKRAELLARQKQLDDASDLYNDMLSTLLSGEKKKFAQMSAEEQLAQERMLAKLAARRRKQEQQELAERKKRQEEELALAQLVEADRLSKEPPVTIAKEVPVLDDQGEKVLLPDGSVKMEMIFETVAQAGMEVDAADILAKQGIMHQLIADNPAVFESLQGLAAEHLGIAAAELKEMTTEEVHMLLVEKGVDINILDYLKNLTNEEAAKHLARQMAAAEAEAKMIRKLLQGKGKNALTQQERDDLLAKQRMLDENAKMYEDMLRDLLGHEQKKSGHMTAEDKAAYDALQAKLALRKARELAKAKEVQVDEHSPLLDLFDDLSTKGPYECRACQTTNDACSRTCQFCKKSRADTIALPEMVLWNAHRMVHQCACPMSVIEVVHRAIGPCTKKNFLQFMQSTVIACNRDAHVWWDVCGVDADQFGCLGNTESELVYAFNDWDIENARFHVFRDKHLDDVASAYLGWTDFREECVQAPLAVTLEMIGANIGPTNTNE